MSGTRSIEDRLRAEYAELWPELRRTLVAMETELAYMLLGITLELDRYERVLVRGRVKECEAAIDALQRRQEGGQFDPARWERYSLLSLPDLVGVRILTFPPRRVADVHECIAIRISGWTADPIHGEDPHGEPIALKYHGRWRAGNPFRSELQIVSLLVGLFWEVEHDAIYKPAPNLRGAVRSLAMQRRTGEVLDALRRFEEEFDRQIEGHLEIDPEDD